MNSDGFWDNINIVQNDEQPTFDNTVTDGESKIKTFRVKNYIPKRSTKKLLKLSHIIGIAVIIILIIIAILLASITKKSTSSVEHAKAREVMDNTSRQSTTLGVPSMDYTKTTEIIENTSQQAVTLGVRSVDYTKTTKVMDNKSAEIVMSDGNRFWIYNPQTGSIKLIWEVKNSTQTFVMDARKTLYWIETNSWKIFSLNLSETETEKNESLFFEGTRTKPLTKPSMALDSINNNLYIVDESIEGLVVINTATKYYALMSIDLVNPRYVVLDAAKGIMFVGSTTWIQRADMNGNNLMTIITSKSISSVTLDPEEEKIYWIHNSEVIESCDYSGQNEHQLASELDYFVDLTFSVDHLFWLRKSNDIEHKMMWSCKIHNGTCINHTMHYNAVNNATFIKATGFSQNNSRWQNFSNHQKCQHISLPTPGGQVSCACNMSLQLFYGTMCKPITKFILYTMNGYIRARTLDALTKVILEPIWPTPYHNERLFKKKDIHFDYDFENDDFYFSDDSKIYKIKLKGMNPQQEVVLTVNSQDFHIRNVAYDWLTENMYYLKISDGEYSVVAFNVKKGPNIQKTLTQSYDYNINTFTLITYPGRGLLFLVTFFRYSTPSIRQFTMNGTLITELNAKIVERLISIDYEVDGLYWIWRDKFVHANLDGTDPTVTDITYLPSDIKFFSIDGQWIYIFPRGIGNVRRMNKITGIYSNFASPLTYHNVAEASGVRIINQIQINENPCRIHNGGCEHFCFFGLNITCDCADGFLVTPKGLCSRP